MSDVRKICPECGQPLVRAEKYEVPDDRIEIGFDRPAYYCSLAPAGEQG